MNTRSKIGLALLFGSYILTSLVIYYLRMYFRPGRRATRQELRNIRRNFQLVFNAGPDPLAAPPSQLDPSVLASLPVLDFSEGNPSLECAVCISEFQVGERVRLLPKCKHCFHLDCIDMWFCYHATCPLCRSHVERFDLGLGATWRAFSMRRSAAVAPLAGEGMGSELVELDLECGVSEPAIIKRSVSLVDLC